MQSGENAQAGGRVAVNHHGGLEAAGLLIALTSRNSGRRRSFSNSSVDQRLSFLQVARLGANYWNWARVMRPPTLMS